MTALQALLGRAGSQPSAASIESPAVPLTDTTILQWIGGTPVHAGVNVTEHGSLAMPAVWRAVTLISGVCAAMPLHAYRRDAADRLPLHDGPESELLADPHPDMTPLELWELMYGSLCLWGNAFALKLRDQGGQLRELWWVAPSRVKVTRAADGTKLYVLDGNTEEPRTDATVLHVPGFGYDGTCGVSPVRMHREGIGLAMAAEQFGARLFGSGGLATGILTSDNRLDDGQAEALKARWKRAGTGLESAHDIRVLGSGAKYQQLTIPPEDAQFLESRRFQIAEVARMFGLPPHLLAENFGSTNWGTGIESQNLGLIMFTLAPLYLTRVEQRLTKMMRPPAPTVGGRRPAGDVYARYSVAGLLRGDAAARSAFYTALWQMGAFSTNDVRALEELGPVEGGDVRYRPLNMGVLGQDDPVTDTAAGDGTDDAGPLTAEAAARAAVEAVQKVYLGVDVVLTDEEARELVRRAGAGDVLAAGPLPESDKPDPAPAPFPPPGQPAPVPAPAPSEEGNPDDA